MVLMSKVTYELSIKMILGCILWLYIIFLVLSLTSVRESLDNFTSFSRDDCLLQASKSTLGSLP